MKNGIELISDERQRQIDVEGFDAERDAGYKSGELALAAITYAMPEQLYRETQMVNTATGGPAYQFEDPWPKSWDASGDKRTKGPNGRPYPCNPFYCGREDAIRRLTKAGALIAAEIDRIQRTQEPK